MQKRESYNEKTNKEHDSLSAEESLHLTKCHQNHKQATVYSTTSAVQSQKAIPSKQECYDAPDGAFVELMEGYERNGERVDMSGPRRCSYSKKTNFLGFATETTILGKEVARTELPNGVSITTMPVELRGITLRQLQPIKANIIRRCVAEAWKDHQRNLLTPEKVTLYDVDKYITRPFTKDSKSSFVERLPSTAGTQPPRFFVSHWWGEPFVKTVACLERFIKDFKKNSNDEDDARGGGMTIDTPIWICAFANNQWDLDDPITVDPKQSSFTKALDLAENRVVSILDAKGKFLK